MNEARLKIIDKLLRKGWCSYLDIAKAINDAIPENCHNPYGLDKVKLKDYDTSFNKKMVELFRSSIGQDFMDIPEIWALANDDKVLMRDGKISSQEDQEYRNIIRSKLIEEEFQQQYKPSLNKIEDGLRRNNKGEVDLKRVKFYRYIDSSYSLFAGDFKKYQAKKKDLELKNQLDNVTKTSVSEKDVKNVLVESDVILEPAVSDKIKQRIRIEAELKKYEEEVNSIISNLQSSITSVGEEKRRGWIKKTINYYKNILELAKSPISNIEKREVAIHIHKFALFLASENLYQMLGDRFEEAIGIFQKLVLIQKHSLEDYEAGEELFAEDFNPDEVRSQMLLDRELVADTILHFARVQLDSHNTDYAVSLLEKAMKMVGPESQIRAKLLNLRSIISSVFCDFDSALEDIDEAYRCAVSSGMDEMELLEIMVSQAELLRAKGNPLEAIKKYKDIISIYRRDESYREGLASALMSISMIQISTGEIDDAEKAIAEAQTIFDDLYSKESDKFLPSLLTVKYIKMCVASQKGYIDNAIELGESILSAFDNANETLKNLCVQESLQTLLDLKELYLLSGNGEGVAASDKKFEEIKGKYNDIINPLLLDAKDRIC